VLSVGTSFDDLDRDDRQRFGCQYLRDAQNNQLDGMINQSTT